jgi:hypothetical protein
MKTLAKILPGTGRGTVRSMVEGALLQRCASWLAPSTPSLRVAVPLPLQGRICA